MNQTQETILKIENLHSGYGPIKALNGVSLEVKKGEIVSLIGSNGAGKSTLLMTMFGSPKASAGQITYQNKNIIGMPTHNISSLGIALVPEGRRIFPTMSVEENLIMGTIANKSKESDTLKDLNTVYELFPRLKERSLQPAGTMSGGEQQMLAIGRGIMSNPDLLLLDEPSLGLAPIIVKQIFETLELISQNGTTIFLVEQNASKALKLAHRGYVLVNGEIKMSGTGEELLANPQIKDAYLGGH